MGIRVQQDDIVSIVKGVKVVFQKFDIPGSRIIHGNVFPLALEVSKESGEQVSVDEATKAITDISGRGIITDLLTKHGGIILRGPRNADPHTFSRLVHAAEEPRGHKPYYQVGLAGKRIVHDKEVFSASEAPQNLWIHQHNEFSRFSKFPTNIHFFCNEAADDGGESPFAHSTELYERINAEMPEFIEEIQAKGIISPDTFSAPRNDDPDYSFTWAGPLSFGHEIKPEDDLTTKKKKAEKQVQLLSHHFTWTANNDLELLQYVPGVRTHPGTGRPVFFNSIASRYGIALDAGATEPPYEGNKNVSSFGFTRMLPTTYGDGEIIPKKYLHRIWELSQECAVLIKMEPGDLALVDNYQVSHGRAPWTKGSRRILVSMWDTDNPAEMFKA
ncbi:hypothetical protein MMC08_005026 [Hypocenomyce scalaris]|nr:hypothetical protein [Hypocenomyce scalaris]